MTRFAALFASLLLAVPAAAQDQVQPAGAEAAGEPMPNVIDPQTAPKAFDLARQKVVDCAGEKFVFAWGAGSNPTKVTLCSKADATPDEVVQMLDDAATKLEQTEAIAEDRRVAIVQQIRAKISELKGTSAAASAPAAAPRSAAAELPVTPVRPAVRPTVVPAASTSAAAAATPVLQAKPRLSFECYTPGILGGGDECITMGRETRLTVTADEPLIGATSLRFLRNGESRAQVALAQMRKGESVRLILPRAVCAGVVEAETKIEVVRGGQVVDSVGPALLRC